MLDTFLNILAVIGIVAVGAFIIVFLSDLLISIIDNSNGIFFKRNKNSNGYTEGGKTYTRPVLLNTNKEEQREALTYEENKREFKQEKPQEQPAPVSQGPQGVDLNKANEEEKFAHNYTDGRENMVAQRQTAPIPAPAPAPRPAPAPAPRPVQRPKEDIDAIIAEISQQSLKELEEEEIKNKQNQMLKEAEEKAKANDELSKANEAKAKELEEKSKELEEKSKELEEKSKEADEKANQLQKQIEELQKQIDSDKATIAKLEEEAKNKKEEVKVVEKVVEVEKIVEGKAKGSPEDIKARIEILKNRLKQNEKELSQNKKEYLPLKRVSLTLESDKKKLRRKEAIVAKQKVILYGVNNYVDIDEERAKKLAEELDLLEGLRLSVQHCEEVMTQNKERYPILERTNQILTRTVGELKEDIAGLEAQLQELETQIAEKPQTEEVEVVVDDTTDENGVDGDTTVDAGETTTDVDTNTTENATETTDEEKPVTTDEN